VVLVAEEPRLKVLEQMPVEELAEGEERWEGGIPLQLVEAFALGDMCKSGAVPERESAKEHWSTAGVAEADMMNPLLQVFEPEERP
jgi:hypothetical protein